jgi:hypothetical protein
MTSRADVRFTLPPLIVDQESTHTGAADPDD